MYLLVLTEVTDLGTLKLCSGKNPSRYLPPQSKYKQTKSLIFSTDRVGVLLPRTDDTVRRTTRLPLRQFNYKTAFAYAEKEPTDSVNKNNTFTLSRGGGTLTGYVLSTQGSKSVVKRSRAGIQLSSCPSPGPSRRGSNTETWGTVNPTKHPSVILTPHSTTVPNFMNHLHHPHVLLSHTSLRPNSV